MAAIAQADARQAGGSRARWLPWGLAALFLALGLAYVHAVPPLEGHDAFAHFHAVAWFRTHRGLPRIEPSTLHVSFELVTQPPLYHMTAAAASAPWPIGPALDLAADSLNPYFNGPANYRQSVTRPGATAGALAPIAAARLVSLLGGLLVLGSAFWMARLLAPDRPAFALAAAAVAALNPYFLFLSTTVSNDAFSAGLSALALAAGLEAWAHHRRPRWWLGVGVAYGLAALAKYSALLVALPLFVLWLMQWRDSGWRRAAAAAVCAALGAGAAGGWWFARSFLLYGQPVPLRAMAHVIVGLNRQPPWSLGHTLSYVPWLVDSFWGVFVALVAPHSYLVLTRWFTGLGLAGALLALVRAARGGDRRRLSALAVLGLWGATSAAGVLYWTRTVTFGEQARLGEIGVAAFAVLVVAGYESWLPPAARPRVDYALAGFMTVLALWMLAFLHQAYRLPVAVAAATPDRPMDARFAGGMRLVGADFPEGARLVAGRSLPVRLYMTADSVVEGDYTLYLHLADAKDNLLFAYDGAPASGRHPTRQWVPGEVFADTYLLRVDRTPAGPVLGTLSLGFYPFERPGSRVAATDGQGRPVGDRVVLGRVRVSGAPQAGAGGALGGSAPALATWMGGIALDSASVAAAPDGHPRAVALEWRADRPEQVDYTVFVQLLDGHDRILAQSDRQPEGGEWPTSTWAAGDVIPDVVTLEQPAGADWRRVIVGLYSADGVRLPLVAAQGQPTPLTPGDALEVWHR